MIPPLQIEAVKTFIESGEDLLADIPEMKTGDRVLVTLGSLKGLEASLSNSSKNIVSAS